MAMATSPTARSKLDPPPPPPPVPQPRFLKPSIWWKGPEEQIREDKHVNRLNELLLPHVQSARMRQPPPGHVRLLFWWSLDELKTSRPKAQMIADIPLDPGGSLDLLAVQKLWGLESVAIINPMRWTIFETADPNRVSALAVHDLSLDRHIFVTERPVTRDTVIKRSLRLFCIDLYFLSVFGWYRLFIQGGYGPNVRAPVPRWYDNAAIFRNGIVDQWKDFSGPALTSTSITGLLVLVEDRRREFAGGWDTAILICGILLIFLWLFDRFVMQLL